LEQLALWHVMSMGNERTEEYSAAVPCFQHITYCLYLTGPSATSSAEAFNKCLCYEQYLKDAGLEVLLKNCLRVIQD
jgi:hypothetical protein